MVRFSEEQIIDDILKKFNDKKISILAPLVRGRKGHYRELFEDVRKQGYLRVRVDGDTQEIQPKMQVDRYKIHDIEVVIDRIKVDKKDVQRLRESVAKALKEGKGLLFIENLENGKVATYSKTLMCTTTGISYEEPSPNTFSFNSPYGACPYCKGLGVVKEPDLLKIIPDKTKNIIDGAIVPLGEYKDNYTFKLIKQILTAYKQNINHPIEKISKEAMDFILFGSEEKVDVNLDFDKKNKSYAIQFDGVVNQIKKSLEDSSSDALQNWAENYVSEVDCPECHGARLKKESLWFKLDNQNISEIARVPAISTRINCAVNVVASRRIATDTSLSARIARISF